MQNQNHPVTSSPKLLPFLRSAPALPAPLLPAMAVRLVRPALVEEAPSLPMLSPAAALAHDARNALTSLHLLSGLLAEPGVLAAGHTHYAADLQSVTHALTGLVSRFATLGADIPADQPPHGKALRPTAVPAPGVQGSAAQREKRSPSAGEALEACTRLLRIVAGSRVEVHVSSENALPPLAIGDDVLSRVLVNLVKNASEAMPAGGAVHILARRALSQTAPAVLVHISDNGPGIPAHALGQVFEPGFSSKRAISNAAEPCGLGLAIVRELVESAGGTVRVASTRRRGTTFELKLPCLK